MPTSSDGKTAGVEGLIGVGSTGVVELVFESVVLVELVESTGVTIIHSH